MSQIIENNENTEINENDEQRIWKVYLHTVPKEISGYDWDKYYVGITKKKPEYRWGSSGQGYKNRFFFRAINKYGWNNIRHEILFSGLTEKEAKDKEVELISYYKSNHTRYRNPSYGYNETDGGDNCFTYSGFRVAQYTLDGNLIKVFDTYQQASEHVGGKIHLERTYSMGYMWKRLKDNEVPIAKIDPYIKTNWLAVKQYDFRGNYIRSYENLSKASNDVDCAPVNIKSALINGTTCKGFQWRYIDDDRPIYDISHKMEYRHYFCYDVEGNFIKEFSSQLQAYKYLYPEDIKRKTFDIPEYVFKNVMNNYYHNYRWTLEYYKKLPSLISINTKHKPFIEISSETNKIVDIYISLSHATTKIGKSKDCLRKALKNGTIFKQSYWRFINLNDLFLESDFSDSFLFEKYKNIINILKDLKED